MKYIKYHALGNDYIVIHPSQFKRDLTVEMIRQICHRNYGVGSDGILWGPLDSQSCDFALKIYNPDGSEAEKSGNGLRIFARSLIDRNFTDKHAFTIETLGGNVFCEVSADKRQVKVEMGRVSFESSVIPVNGPDREVLNETLVVNGEKLKFCAATVGNPHCVILTDALSKDTTQQFGPHIETHSLFPNRTNVQFMKVLDRSRIQIEIWERGAGYTLASGSSSTAAAGVARRLDLCDHEITVHMPGGQILIEFDDQFKATMSGSVTRVCEGAIDNEMFHPTR